MNTHSPAPQHDRPFSDPLAETSESSERRAYERPALETVGSVPRLTGGSDIFGDDEDDD